LDTEGVRITHQTILPEQVAEEVARLRKALDEAAAEARDTRQRITALHGPAIGNIFGAHESAFDSPAFRDQLDALIRTKVYSAERSRADRYESLKDKPAVTLDGTTIRLLGNIELSPEAAHCIDRGAEGIGLYRTEFLYLNKTADPTEEEHFEAYRSVVGTLGA